MLTDQPPAGTPTIRGYRESDRDDVYDVCVRTGDAGGDARGLYDSDDVLGDVFAGPYIYLEPDLAFMAEDAGRVVGYVVGTADTRAFAAAYRERWIPQVADRYPTPDKPPASKTEQLLTLHHNPEHMVVPGLEDYPAHLHIDLLPAYQRQGLGRQLMHTMLAALAAAGAPAVHLGVATANTSARAFYARLGFHELPLENLSDVTYLGRSTAL